VVKLSPAEGKAVEADISVVPAETERKGRGSAGKSEVTRGFLFMEILRSSFQGVLPQNDKTL
jgi:hypothetical protein